jgi:hypothetical protein
MDGNRTWFRGPACFVDNSSESTSLFYDKDIYIHIASNLSKAPVAQLTLLGGPGEIQVATYYKEPVGFP